MSKISFLDKVLSDSLTHLNVNEIKTSVNSLYDTVIAITGNTSALSNYYNKTQINTYTGQTQNNISYKLDKTTFNTYTGSTALNGFYGLPQTITYTTTIPFNKALTVISGKTLTTTDTFTIGSNPVNGSVVETWLDGDDTHEPNLLNFNYIGGSYDKTSGIRNLITMKYINSKSYIIFNNTIKLS